MKKSIEEMIGGYVRVEPTEFPITMHEREVSSNSDGLRCCEGSERGALHDSSIFLKDLSVNADADAYVETLQIIVVVMPWIDSTANGGRPLYVFQQDSAPSHKALNTHD
ncbi:hypothetical protein ACTXT7_015146 [Hymenolepis weldensis]